MKNTLRSIFLLLLFFYASQNLIAQEVYTDFHNPSFEDNPRPQHPPQGWWDCGFPSETPPDVHPNPASPFFGVKRPAQDGDTYLGMVVRQNDTWESVAQRLNRPLEANQDYTFNIHMCRSPNYVSSIRGSDEEINFTTPILLRVWGGTGFCNKRQLLYNTELVDHTDWKKYIIQFHTEEKYGYIILEAFFQTPAVVSPNGNILLDNLSSIYIVRDAVSTPLDKLKQYVSLSDFQISFNRKNELIKKSNRQLNGLGKQIQNIENVHFVFSVFGENKTQIEERIKNIDSSLKSLNLDEKKYSVTTLKNVEEDVEWISEHPFLFIGVIEKK